MAVVTVPQKKARLDKPGGVVGMFSYYVSVAVTYCIMSLFKCLYISAAICTRLVLSLLWLRFKDRVRVSVRVSSG